MARYFFHTFMHGDCSPDLEGTVLSGAAEAHAQAMRTSGEILKDIDGHFRHGRWSMRVVGESGDTISEIKISVNETAASSI